MRNKELNERIMKLEESNRKLCDIVEFLTQNDKNDIAVRNILYCLGDYKKVIEYLYDGKLVRLGSPFSISHFDVINNDVYSATLKWNTLYFQLDKVNQKIIEIPKPAFVLEKELADKKETEKKSSK